MCRSEFTKGGDNVAVLDSQAPLEFFPRCQFLIDSCNQYLYKENYNLGNIILQDIMCLLWRHCDFDLAQPTGNVCLHVFPSHKSGILIGFNQNCWPLFLRRMFGSFSASLFYNELYKGKLITDTPKFIKAYSENKLFEQKSIDLHVESF